MPGGGDNGVLRGAVRRAGDDCAGESWSDHGSVKQRDGCE